MLKKEASSTLIGKLWSQKDDTRGCATRQKSKGAPPQVNKRGGNGNSAEIGSEHVSSYIPWRPSSNIMSDHNGLSHEKTRVRVIQIDWQTRRTVSQCMVALSNASAYKLPLAMMMHVWATGTCPTWTTALRREKWWTSQCTEGKRRAGHCEQASSKGQRSAHGVKSEAIIVSRHSHCPHLYSQVPNTAKGSCRHRQIELHSTLISL